MDKNLGMSPIPFVPMSMDSTGRWSADLPDMISPLVDLNWSYVPAPGTQQNLQHQNKEVTNILKSFCVPERHFMAV